MPLDPADIRKMAESYAKAWSSGDAASVAAHYAEDGEIAINDGDPVKGRAELQDMVAGFYEQVPGLTVRLDDLKTAGDNAVFHWTLEGVHAETGKTIRLQGWEEWAIDGDVHIKQSRGRYDAEEFDRQVREGA
jgi:uncharacterized protein (TIGR02246 family)